MFEPIVSNPEIDVHPAPLEGWDRVAVVSMWDDARKARRSWPEAAVVGPLRTAAGADELVRNLLANPQIRRVIWDGPDLTPDQQAAKAIRLLAGGVQAELAELMPRLAEQVDMGRVHSMLREIEFEPRGLGPEAQEPFPAHERPSGAWRIEPPPVVAEAAAPPGDPGDRVAGETVAEIWPRLLRAVLGSGAVVPTQYGETRELLNLVSVIRDPQRSAQAEQEDEAARVYWERLFKSAVPAGAAYTYGSRLRAQLGIDQIAVVGDMLGQSPGTRAGCLTPWKPEHDCGEEGDRPCLVGLWFRVFEGKLCTTVSFRSHDLYGAYRMNLTALCRLASFMAALHKREVGPLTCVSYSAHVYARDWDAARAAADAWRPKGIDWDPRSTWVVRWVEGAERPLQAVAGTPDGGSVIEVFEGRSPAQVRAKVERSGLLQSVGNALWLGDELARVYATAGVRRAT